MSNRSRASRLLSQLSQIRVCRPSRLENHQVVRSRFYSTENQGPRFMDATTNGVQTPPSDASREAAAASGPRKLKILMLHGYTQSGPLFHAKTRSLEKLLAKAFPPAPPPPHKPSALSKIYPGGPQLFYPTAPIRLLPADIPGFSPDAPTDDSSPAPDAWGWWKKDDATGGYANLEEGLDRIAEAIKEAGGIDGVIGFSQGAAAAAMVASLLQPGRKEAFDKYREAHPDALAYPRSWEGLRELHPQGLKFAAAYSGFYAGSPWYTAFYEPKISCPVLHFIGSLDTVVEESRSLELVAACEEGTGKTVYHPGGHFVPVSKEWGAVLVGFIRQCLEVKQEENVGDVDMPL